MDNQTLIAAYFARIGLPGISGADLASLHALVAAQRLAIPFENLDIPLGRGVRIDRQAITAKLLHQRRGGYCYEQNGLLGMALAALGFMQRPLLARVRLGLPEDACPPRTHVMQLVDIDGESWIADAGFGGSFVPPMRLADGELRETADGVGHRLVRQSALGSAAGQWLLQRRAPGKADWDAQYSFDLAEVAPDDVQMANHWTSTRPGTRFTDNVIASRVLPDGFIALTGRQLSKSCGEAQDKQDIQTAEQLHGVLQHDFGICLTPAEAATLFAFAGQ